MTHLESIKNSRELIAECIPVLIALISLSGTYMILLGVVKGLGEQNKASMLALILLLPVSLPLAVIMGR